MNKKWFFSLISGEIYEIDESEVRMLDPQQLPLKCKPPIRCNKCNGKFYTSYYVTGRYFEICKKCAKKTVDFNYFRNVQANNQQPNL